MAKFSKGDKVTQIVTPIQGEVIGFQVDQETGDLQVAVAWGGDADGDGKVDHVKYFKESEIALDK